MKRAREELHLGIRAKAEEGMNVTVVPSTLRNSDFLGHTLGVGLVQHFVEEGPHGGLAESFW